MASKKAGQIASLFA